MSIGEIIRRHRLRLKLTQSQFAQRIGVTQQAVSRWENDPSSAPDYEQLVALVQVCGDALAGDLSLVSSETQEFLEHGSNGSCHSIAEMQSTMVAALRRMVLEDQTSAIATALRNFQQSLSQEATICFAVKK